MSGPRNIPVPRRGAMPAIGIDQIKPGNSLMVSPGNYGTFSTLQAAYDWLASSACDAEMGALSATNRRTLILSPGQYLVDNLTFDSNYVDVYGVGDPVLYRADAGTVATQSAMNVRFNGVSFEAPNLNNTKAFVISNVRRGTDAACNGTTKVITATGIGVGVRSDYGSSGIPYFPPADEVYIRGDGVTEGWYSIKSATADTITIDGTPGTSGGSVVDYAVLSHASEYRDCHFNNLYANASGGSAVETHASVWSSDHLGGLWWNCTAGNHSWRTPRMLSADLDAAAVVDVGGGVCRLAMTGHGLYGRTAYEEKVVITDSGHANYNGVKIVVAIAANSIDILATYAAHSVSAGATAQVADSECRATAYNCQSGTYSWGGDWARNVSGKWYNCSSGDFSWGGCSGTGSVCSGTWYNCKAGERSWATSFTFSGRAYYCEGDYGCFAAAITVAGYPRFTGMAVGCVSTILAAGGAFGYRCTTISTVGGEVSGVLIDCSVSDAANEHPLTDYLAGTFNASIREPASFTGKVINCHPYAAMSRTAATTVRTFYNGATFDNTGAAGSVTFTLPTPAKGLKYKFVVVAAQAVVIEPGVAAIQKGLNTATGTVGDYITSSTAGDWIEIECLDGAAWTCIGASQAWTEEA